jgi:hypothetical protein
VNLHDAIGSDSNEVVLCRRGGVDDRLPRSSKSVVAARIVAAAVELWNARQAS